MNRFFQPWPLPNILFSEKNPFLIWQSKVLDGYSTSWRIQVTKKIPIPFSFTMKTRGPYKFCMLWKNRAPNIFFWAQWAKAGAQVGILKGRGGSPNISGIVHKVTRFFKKWRQTLQIFKKYYFWTGEVSASSVHKLRARKVYFLLIMITKSRSYWRSKNV